MMASDKLTPKQEMFCKEYLIDLNATQAAVRAGYSEKTGHEQGSQLLAKLSIQNRVQQLLEERSNRVQLSADEVLWELKNILQSDIKNYVDIDPNTGAIRAKGFDDMPEGASRALQSIEEDRVIKESADGAQTTVHDKIKFRLCSKEKMIELAMRHLGMLKDKVELSGDVGLVVRAEDMLKVYLELKSGAGKNATGGQ